MKKKIIKLDKALSLDKETVAKLNDEQLGALEGGSNTCNGGGKEVQAAEAFPTIGSCQGCSCN
ncbi:hypothetical protein GCM10027422_23960 [Hymenobacter arcticus]